MDAIRILLLTRVVSGGRDTMSHFLAVDTCRDTRRDAKSMQSKEDMNK
ncbi:hypothetical protein [Paraburkholderia sp. GAS334]